MILEAGTMHDLAGLFHFVVDGDITGTTELHDLVMQWKDQHLFLGKVQCLFKFYNNPEKYIADESEAFTLTMLFPLAMCNYKSAV